MGRLGILLLVLLGAAALTWALYVLSGGRVVFFALPLVFAGPLVWRRRRG
jgi:hypothetical protein